MPPLEPEGAGLQRDVVLLAGRLGSSASASSVRPARKAASAAAYSRRGRASSSAVRSAARSRAAAAAA